MAERIDAAALTRQVQDAISRALADVFAEFRQGADSAYAGTRFAGTFQIQPASITRDASLVNAAPLFHVVEYPTRAHPIVARNVPLLRFYWQKAGRWFRGPSVQHPGTHGKQLIDPLFAAANARFGALLGRYLDELNRVA